MHLVDLLSSWLQFADLKPGQQVILAHTLTQVGLGDGVEFSGRHCRKSEILKTQEETGNGIRLHSTLFSPFLFNSVQNVPA